MGNNNPSKTITGTNFIDNDEKKMPTNLSADINLPKSTSEQKLNDSSIGTTSTVISDAKFSRGWVDEAKILTKDEFINRLKQNLK